MPRLVVKLCGRQSSYKSADTFLQVRSAEAMSVRASRTHNDHFRTRCRRSSSVAPADQRESSQSAILLFINSSSAMARASRTAQSSFRDESEASSLIGTSSAARLAVDLISANCCSGFRSSIQSLSKLSSCGAIFQWHQEPRPIEELISRRLFVPLHIRRTSAGVLVRPQRTGQLKWRCTSRQAPKYPRSPFSYQAYDQTNRQKNRIKAR